MTCETIKKYGCCPLNYKCNKPLTKECHKCLAEEAKLVITQEATLPEILETDND